MAVYPATLFPLFPASGRVHSSEVATVQEVYDTDLTKLVSSHPDGSTTSLHWAFLLPGDYLAGAAEVKLRWRTTDANTGHAARWQVEHIVKSNGVQNVSGSPTQVAADSTNTGAGFINEVTISISPGGSASQLHVFKISRLGGHANDTVDQAGLFLEGEIAYPSDVTARKGFVWITPEAMRLSTASNLTSRAYGTSSTINPHAAKFANAAEEYAMAIFTLPTNYGGGLTVRPVIASGPSSLNNYVYRVDMAKRGVGDDLDPTLTTGTEYTITHGGGVNNITLIPSAQNATISPSAGDDLILKFIRMGNAAADTNTDEMYLIGIMLTWDTIRRNPGMIDLSPAFWVPPASGGMSPQVVNRTNFSEFVQRCADGSTLVSDAMIPIPSTYSTGGELVVRWSSPQASGNARFRLDYASPAAASDSDPTLTGGTAVDSANAGANKINEVRLPLASLAALDAGNLRLAREGGHANDTIGGIVDVVRAWVETNIAA